VKHHRNGLFAHLACLLATLACFDLPCTAAADEAGVSFWLPGQYGSFAAVPSEPGWSFESSYYHASADDSREISFQRGGAIQAGMTSPSDLFMFTPTYAFATRIFGAQAAFGTTILYGKNATSVSETPAGSGGNTQSRSDEVLGFGDIYPTATLKWSKDVHNFMVYATTGVQAGAYQLNRLSALGIGHWAADGGVGYTYFNEKAGIEGSVVFGLTYNFINPYTQYQSGTDAHLDWALSPILTDKFHIGAVGYIYNQITGDGGLGARLGDFKSRVAGIGPQIGFFIPFFDRESYLNLRAYSEFDTKNRLDGLNAFITFSIEASGQKKPSVANLR
jgi:hypothetical protein